MRTNGFYILLYTQISVPSTQPVLGVLVLVSFHLLDIEDVGGVGVEGSIAVRRVVGAGGVGVEGSIAVRRVVAAGGVGVEGINAVAAEMKKRLLFWCAAHHRVF